MILRLTAHATAALAAALCLLASSCTMHETVRDSHGNIIYSGPVEGSIHESDEERAQRVLEKEWEMGYTP